jgi:hypothetical protein
VYGHFCRFIQLGAFRGGRCSGPPHVPKGGMVADVAMDMFEKKRVENWEYSSNTWLKQLKWLRKVFF